MYVDDLKATQFPNEHSRSKKQKAKLVKHYGERISSKAIQTIAGRFGSLLVFNSRKEVGEAVKQVYILGIADNMKYVALNLRQTGQEATQTAEPL